MIPGYRAAQVFDPSVSKVSDVVALALTPGSTHGTVAWSRGYVVGAYENAPDDQVWRLIDFLGGAVRTTPTRAVAGGCRTTSWTAATAPCGANPTLTPHLGALRSQCRRNQGADRPVPVVASGAMDGVVGAQFRQEIDRALTREISVDQAITNLKNSWTTDAIGSPTSSNVQRGMRLGGRHAPAPVGRSLVSRGRGNERVFALGTVGPTMLAMLVLVGGPIAYSLYISFHEWYLTQPATIGTFAGFEQLPEVFRDDRFWRSVRVTLYSLP